MSLHPVPKPTGKRRKPSSGLPRRPMRKRSKRSAHSGGHLFYGPEYVDEARRAWIRRQPCHVTGMRSGESRCGFVRLAVVVPAHVKSRGSSGRDAGNMIPLDWALHEEQHRLGWPAFCRKYSIADRFAVAAAYEAQYLAQGGA